MPRDPPSAIGVAHDNSPAISEGAAGPGVKLTQYLPACWTVSYNQMDGIFGPVTKTSVEHTDSRVAWE